MPCGVTEHEDRVWITGNGKLAPPEALIFCVPAILYLAGSSAGRIQEEPDYDPGLNIALTNFRS
jgi:hypothetical protein